MRKMNTFQNIFPRPNLVPITSQSPQIKNLPQPFIKPNLPVVRALSNYHRPQIGTNFNNDFIPSSLTIPNPNRVMNPMNNLKPVSIINIKPGPGNIPPAQPINKFIPLNNNNLITNPNIPNAISQNSIIINRPPGLLTTNPSPISQGSIVVNKNNIPPFNGNIVTNNNIIMGNTPPNNPNNINNIMPMNNNINPVSVINMGNNLVGINNNIQPNQPTIPKPITIPNPTPAPITIQKKSTIIVYNLIINCQIVCCASFCLCSTTP